MCPRVTRSRCRTPTCNLQSLRLRSHATHKALLAIAEIAFARQPRTRHWRSAPASAALRSRPHATHKALAVITPCVLLLCLPPPFFSFQNQGRQRLRRGRPGPTPPAPSPRVTRPTTPGTCELHATSHADAPEFLLLGWDVIPADVELGQRPPILGIIANTSS
jgi:hypothetical protein